MGDKIPPGLYGDADFIHSNTGMGGLLASEMKSFQWKSITVQYMTDD